MERGKAALCPCIGGAGRAGFDHSGSMHARLVAGGVEVVVPLCEHAARLMVASLALLATGCWAQVEATVSATSPPAPIPTVHLLLF
jgi:hypothetical protein